VRSSLLIFHSFSCSEAKILCITRFHLIILILSAPSGVYFQALVLRLNIAIPEICFHPELSWHRLPAHLRVHLKDDSAVGARYGIDSSYHAVGFVDPDGKMPFNSRAAFKRSHFRNGRRKPYPYLAAPASGRYLLYFTVSVIISDHINIVPRMALRLLPQALLQARHSRCNLIARAVSIFFEPITRAEVMTMVYRLCF